MKRLLIVTVGILSIASWGMFRTYFLWRKRQDTTQFLMLYRMLPLGGKLHLKYWPPPNFTMGGGDFPYQRWMVTFPRKRWMRKYFLIQPFHATLDISYKKKGERILGKWIYAYEPFPHCIMRDSERLPECPVR